VTQSASVVKVPVSNWSRRSSGIVSEEEEEHCRNPTSPGRSDCSYFLSQKEPNTLKTLETFNNCISPTHSKIPSPRKNLTPEFLASKKLHLTEAGSKGRCSSPAKTSLNFSRGSPPCVLVDPDFSELADISLISSISDRRVSKLDLFRSLQTESGYNSKSESKTNEELEIERQEVSPKSSEGCVDLTVEQGTNDRLHDLPVASAHCVESGELPANDICPVTNPSDQESEIIQLMDTDTMVSHRLRSKNTSDNKVGTMKQSDNVLNKKSKAKIKSKNGLIGQQEEDKDGCEKPKGHLALNRKTAKKVQDATKVDTGPTDDKGGKGKVKHFICFNPSRLLPVLDGSGWAVHL
jgi:hypothetical protein